MKLAVLIAFTLASASCAPIYLAQQSSLPDGAREYRNRTYWAGRGFDRFRHRLSVYVPAGEGPHPVIVFAHGGGWRTGDPNGTMGVYKKLGRRLAARGFVAVIPGYRLAPDHPHPDQIRDVARAIAWTLEHAASYRGDPAQVYAMGHSAGAQLVALAACDPRWLREQHVDPARLAGVIPISGPYDLPELEREAPVMVRDAFGRKEETWKDASPATHLGAAPLPRFLVVAAENDPELLKRHAKSFAASLAEKGATVTEKIIADRTHMTIVLRLGDDGDVLGDAVAEFIRNTSADRR